MTINKAILTLLTIAGTAVISSAELLYFVDDTGHDLKTVDTNTLAVNTIGSLGLGGNFADLAWNASTQTMYYSGGRGDDNLYTIDLGTGAASLVGGHGVFDMFGLSFDGAGNLFGTNGASNFYSVNSGTGAASLIGNTSVYPGGLTYNSSTGQMILAEAGGGQMYSINTGTAASTLLASPGGLNDNGLVYSAASNTYFAMDYNGNLYQYDSAFNRTLLGGGFGAVASVELASPVPEPATMTVLGLAALAALRRKKSK